MPRNSAGAYSLPLPAVVPGTTIVASFENTTDSDIAAELTNSLDRNGRGGMLAPFKIADGTVSAPGIAFTLDPDNGWYRIGADDWAGAVAGVKVIEFTPTGVGILGTLGVNGPVITSGAFGITGALNLSGPLTVQGVTNLSESIGAIGSTVWNRSPLIVNGANGVGHAAFMGFSRPGAWAAYFGIDTDNTWRVGGGNMGNVAYRLLHEGNSFTLFSGPVACPDRLGVNSATAPLQPLDVKVAADTHFVANFGPDFANLGVLNDGGSGWKNLALAGGATTLAPTYDNLTSMGFFSPYRWTAIYAVNGTIQTSDARQKRNIAPCTLGLAFIEDLNPVSYQWIVEKNVVTRVPDGEETIPAHYDSAGKLMPETTRTVYRDEVTAIPGTRTHYGLVAQDVKNAVVAAGVTFGGLYEGGAANDELGLAYNEFIAPLVTAVQELSARLKVLEGKP